MFFDLKCDKLLLKMPTIATRIFSIQRADRKSTSGLQRHCLLTPYRFRWMQDLTQISLDAGFDGVLIFKAKTSELLSYYMEKFGARQVASYDPYRLVIWEDAAEDILSTFTMEVRDNGSERA